MPLTVVGDDDADDVIRCHDGEIEEWIGRVPVGDTARVLGEALRLIMDE